MITGQSVSQKSPDKSLTRGKRGQLKVERRALSNTAEKSPLPRKDLGRSPDDISTISSPGDDKNASEYSNSHIVETSNIVKRSSQHEKLRTPLDDFEFLDYTSGRLLKWPMQDKGTTGIQVTSHLHHNSSLLLILTLNLPKHRITPDQMDQTVTVVIMTKLDRMECKRPSNQRDQCPPNPRNSLLHRPNHLHSHLCSNPPNRSRSRARGCSYHRQQPCQT